MKYFPRYRIYCLLGWLTPALLCYYLLRLLDFHWALKVFLFLLLYPILLLFIFAMCIKVGKAWNAYQRRRRESTIARPPRALWPRYPSSSSIPDRRQQGRRPGY